MKIDDSLSRVAFLYPMSCVLVLRRREVLPSCSGVMSTECLLSWSLLNLQRSDLSWMASHGVPVHTIVPAGIGVRLHKHS